MSRHHQTPAFHMERLNQHIYSRGFFLVDSEHHMELDKFPHLSDWNITKKAGLTFYVHPEQHLQLHEMDSQLFILLGHAYNPFTMEHREQQLLERLATTHTANRQSFHESLNQLTGSFLFARAMDVSKPTREIELIGDTAGMLQVAYGIVAGHVCISSHTQLIGDVFNLKASDYINRLIHYRFYHLLGKSLPGDLTPYEGIKRLIPNHTATIRRSTTDHMRFYPSRADVSRLAQDKRNYEQKVEACSSILANSLHLITRKWSAPAISLTGGCDSKTTLACAKDYDHLFKYFSYNSSAEEAVDAQAASHICSALGLRHKIDVIPEEDQSTDDIRVTRAIIEMNCGNIGKCNHNDARKRAYYAKHADFDVEVKSWVSEVARAYYSKRFLKRSFPKTPTPRLLTSLYKFFLFDRQLVSQTNAVFQRYIDEYMALPHGTPFDWQDMFFWEFRMSSWNGLTITGEHQYAYEVTIPYNNRMLLELMLSIPLEYRIRDQMHKDIRAHMNPFIDKTGVSVVNVKHTRTRALLERLYLEIHSRVPF